MPGGGPTNPPGSEVISIAACKSRAPVKCNNPCTFNYSENYSSEKKQALANLRGGNTFENIKRGPYERQLEKVLMNQ